MKKLFFPRAITNACVATLLLSLLGGCSFFSSDKSLYKEAGVVKPLHLPEGISTQTIESAYHIPEVEAREFDYVDSEEALVIPRPAPMSQDAEFARVKIQKVGERRWVLAEAPTSQVWPLVQSFLARNGILVAKAQPKTGQIETHWLGFKIDNSTKSRYRVRIEKGVRDNSSEVHVLHQQVEKVASSSNSSQWPDTSSDAEREAWLLDELAVNIAEGISNRAASLLGQSVGGEDKVTLRRQAGEPVIDIRLDKERTQATLAHALTQEGLTLWHEEAESGVFYFGYDDPIDEPGLWKKITFRGNDDMPEKAPAAFRDILSSMSHSGQPIFGDVIGFAVNTDSKPVLGYLLRVQRTDDDLGEKLVVYVRNTRGEVLPYREAKKLMIAIRRNLI